MDKLKREKYRPNLYIDSSIKKIFDTVSQKTFIDLDTEQLAHFSQIYRSGEGRDLFEKITGRKIDSDADIENLFRAVALGEINLKEVLQSPALKEYGNRTSPYALD